MIESDKQASQHEADRTNSQVDRQSKSVITAAAAAEQKTLQVSFIQSFIHSQLGSETNVVTGD